MFGSSEGFVVTAGKDRKLLKTVDQVKGGSQNPAFPPQGGLSFWVTFVTPLFLSETLFQTENKACVSLEDALCLSRHQNFLFRVQHLGLCPESPGP